jgi:hypothetical protein
MRAFESGKFGGWVDVDTSYETGIQSKRLYELVDARVQSVDVLIDILGRLPTSLQTLRLEVVIWTKRKETFGRGWKSQRQRKGAVVRWICECGEVERWGGYTG